MIVAFAIAGLVLFMFVAVCVCMAGSMLDRQDEEDSAVRRERDWQWPPRRNGEAT